MTFVFQRFVPFAAVASANMVNIPLMRQVCVVLVFWFQAHLLTSSSSLGLLLNLRTHRAILNTDGYKTKPKQWKSKCLKNIWTLTDPDTLSQNVFSSPNPLHQYKSIIVLLYYNISYCEFRLSYWREWQYQMRKLAK